MLETSLQSKAGLLRVCVGLVLLGCASTAVLDVRTCGAVPDSLAHNLSNAAAITACLAKGNAENRTVLVPAGLTFHAVGGIHGVNLNRLTLRIDGTLAAVPDFDSWPCPDGHKYLDLVACSSCSHFTVNGNGTIDGEGLKWWNKWVEGGIKGKHRPHLLVIEASQNVLVEGITFLNSPNYHLLLQNVAWAEVRFVTIHVNREAIRQAKKRQRLKRLALLGGMHADSDPVLQPEDLNTDGIDPSGRDIWIHDCYINNDDDSIAVKPCTQSKCSLSPCSQNMLIENMVLSGFGASIGSVPPDNPPNCVRNITFRNISMPGTGKGIYVKSNPSCDKRPNVTGVIRDILYEDVRIVRPRWWPIWIGPQQQHQPFHKLGEDCSLDYPISGQCPTQGCVDFRNITLRNIAIDEPLLSPGVILGNVTNPAEVTFDGVVVTKWASPPPPSPMTLLPPPPPIPYGRHFKCEFTNLRLAPNSTNDPEPVCHN